ncbi:MAG TPA: D-alanine--D-alanine ligase [Betaproteobacteria bacterium]|nr:D-alanine--D-alanine ligase [Betaproteobacteria bacterium]
MSGLDKVGVLLGGRSAEREVSLDSGNGVLQALRRRGVDAYPFDTGQRGLDALVAERFTRVFIALHGRYGEDGAIQGALDLLRIPYTGSGVLASALAMDKWRTKLVWQALGISTPRYALLNETTDFRQVADALGLPLMVKPATEGSSIGITKVRGVETLEAAYRAAAQYDAVVLAEQFIGGQELTAAILGDAALPLVRLDTPHDFYDYDAKYVAEDTGYDCPCGLPPAQERRLQALALEAFRALGGRGWGRVDLMLDGGGTPYFLEANTVPGMTGHSLVPIAASQAGMSYDDLVLRILSLAATGEE